MAFSTGPMGILTVTNGKSTPRYPGSTSGYSVTDQHVLPKVPISTSNYTNEYGGGGGGGATSGQVQGASTYSQPAPDPYAAWGGQDSYNRLVSGYDEQIQNVYGTSKDAANNYALGYNTNIADFLYGLGKGQKSIDERGVQAELAKKQGFNSILDMVGQGLSSSFSHLAGKGSTNSSAADAYARAYGTIGNRRAADVNNQYQNENREIGLAQEDLQAQTALSRKKLETGKQQSVNNIVIDARDKLAAIDAAMAEASLPDKIELEQRRNEIQGQVMDILSQYDQKLTSGIAKVKPTSTDDRRKTAFGMATAGMASTNPFNFSAEVPPQFLGTGPSSSGLPIYTRAKREE